jgi:hypothetical protein
MLIMQDDASHAMNASEMVELDSIEFLKAMIYERSTIVLVAKYAHEVLREFYSVPVYVR